MASGAAHALAALLLEDANLRSARLAVNDRDDPGVRYVRGTGHDLAAVGLDEQHGPQCQFFTGRADCAVDNRNAARRYPVLASASLNDGVHHLHLCKRNSLYP